MFGRVALLRAGIVSVRTDILRVCGADKHVRGLDKILRLLDTVQSDIAKEAVDQCPDMVFSVKPQAGQVGLETEGDIDKRIQGGDTLGNRPDASAPQNPK